MRPEYVMYGCIAGFVVLLLIVFIVYMREERNLKALEWEEREKELQRKQELLDVMRRRLNREQHHAENLRHEN